MTPTSLPSSPLPGLRTVELTAAHLEVLQRFFEANPEYSIAVTGQAAGPDEAFEEIHGQIPEGWGFTKRWLIGYTRDGDNLEAMANVVSDLLAPSVWHIGLFVVATARHGTGESQELYRGLETWAAANGAAWLRLGVVQGNVRAERFWERLGFVQVRTRSGVQMGPRAHTIRVMVKSLHARSLAQYLSLVERDRPETPGAAAPEAAST